MPSPFVALTSIFCNVTLVIVTQTLKTKICFFTVSHFVSFFMVIFY